MSDFWIKVEKSTPDKPEVFQIAAILNLDPDLVLGKLIRAWSWLDSNSEDGHIKCHAQSVTNVLKPSIDRVTGVQGFSEAMEVVGWLDKNSIPNFDRHLGKSAKKRANDAERKRKSRNKPEECHAQSVTESGLDKSRVDKSRVDNNKDTYVDTDVSTPQAKKNSKTKKELDYSSWPEIPDGQIMTDWHAMRKRLKANVSQTVITTFGKELNTAVKHGFTVDQCLSECITRNWRGFKFEWLLNAGVSGYAKPNRKEYLDQNDTSWADSIEDSANFRYSPSGGQGFDQLDLPPIEGDFSRVGECGEGQGKRGGDAPTVDPGASRRRY